VLDEAVVERVNDLGTVIWSGTTYRHASAAFDGLSGRGAVVHGGRWNPPDSFETLYLATPVVTCMAELERLAAAQSLDPVDLLNARRPRMLHTITVHEAAVLDLRSDAALASVGLERADITDDDWSGCQAIGHAAHFLGLGGVLAPSATGGGLVLAAFESRLDPDQLSLTESVQLTEDLYRELISPT